MAISKTFKFAVYTVIVIVFLGILSLYFFYNPSDSDLFPKCPFYVATGLYCPGCGSQRAIHEIITGNILKGLGYNLLLVVVFLVLGYQGVILILKLFGKKLTKNILHRSITTYAILIFVILFWILRNINIFPFTELAP